MKICLLAFTFAILIGLVSSKISSQTLAVYGQTQPSFGTPFDISQSDTNATNPDIWNVGTHVYVVWDLQNSSGLDFRESPDGGATWSPPLSSPPLNLAPKGGSASPLLSANGSNVYIAWSEIINGVAQIVEATSTNYGQSFSSVTQLTYGNSSNITPVIASWGNNVYVAWSTGTYSFVSCSNDSGVSWTLPYNYGNQHEPEIAAWGGQYVYAVSDAGMVVSSNNCETWQSIQGLHPWGSEPWVWGYGPNAYATWESKGNTSVVYYTYSNNYGANWTKVAELSTSLNNTWAPMLWAYNNSAWIAVHTDPGGVKSQVYMYTTSDAGANWTGPIALSQSPQLGSDTGFPFTVTSSDGENVFVAWSQQTSPSTWQFYASYSSNAGLNWTAAPGIDVSQNPTGTQASSDNDLANGAIASSGANCYAVWQYTVGSSNQIYFSSTQYSPPSTTTTSSSSTSASSTVSGLSPTTTSSTSSASSSSSTTSSSTSDTSAHSTLTSISTISTTSSSFYSSTSKQSLTTSSSTTAAQVTTDQSTTGTVSSPLFGADLDVLIALGLIGLLAIAAFGFSRKMRKSRDY